jgi:type IV secretory pathway TrbD component
MYNTGTCSIIALLGLQVLAIARPTVYKLATLDPLFRSLMKVF